VVLNGRIAGVSGILGGLARPQPAIFRGGSPRCGPHRRATRLGSPRGAAGDPGRHSVPVLVARDCWWESARARRGCTTATASAASREHRPRSVAATLAFMAAGFATVYVVRHLIGS